MGRPHLDCTHCLACGKPHQPGLWLILHQKGNEQGWCLGRFCSYVCMKRLINEMIEDGINVPDDLICVPMRDDGFSQEDYQIMMRGCPTSDMGAADDQTPPTHGKRRPRDRATDAVTWKPMHAAPGKNN